MRSLATPSTFYRYYVHRCTTAGTSAATEPTWNAANNGTTGSGGATFANVTGQSAYGWSAAAGTLYTFTNAGVVRPAGGDRVFVSSDHTETSTGVFYSFSTGFGSIQILSVNRAGSVPPIAADILSGAALVASGTVTFDAGVPTYWQGFTFTLTGASSFRFNNSYLKTNYFKNCAFVMSTDATGRLTTSNAAKVVFDNTTIQFGHAGQQIAAGAYSFDVTWLNTSAAISGTIPTTLFASTSYGALLLTCRGINLSAVTGTLVAGVNVGGVKALLDGCRIAPAVTRYGAPTAASTTSDEVELASCYDGTNYISERHTAAGAVTVDRSTVLSGGAQDGIGAFSLKLVSNANSDAYAMPLDTFWLDVDNTLVGTPRIATVEVISSGSLNNNDVRLELEYRNAAGSPVTSFTDSLATVLTSTAALPTSSATWLNPPTTPVKQYVQATFTPMTAGRVRGRVRLGKTSTTVWVNPKIAIA